MTQSPKNALQAPDPSAPNAITISTSGVVRTLGVIIGLLLCASTAAAVWNAFGLQPDVYPLFFVDHEANLPTYFSAMQLLFAATLLAAIASLEHRKGSPFSVHWWVLALGFALMSADEICSVHERLIKPIRSLFGARQLGIFHFAWVVPAIIAVIGAGGYFWRFLGHLSRSTRREFVVAAVLYLGGAIGMEMVGGRHAELYGQANHGYLIYSTLEEGLEMVGSLVFIRALLRHLAVNHGSLVLGIQALASSARLPRE